MTHFLTTAWHIDPIVLVGFVAATGGYVAVTFRLGSNRSDLNTRRLTWFIAGMALLLLAVTSPLDALAEEYLLSAHMVQHLLLSQVIPPLLLLGLPAALVLRALKNPGIAAIERQVRRPLVAWTAGILVLWLWHVPALFDFAAANHTAGHLHHLTVLIAGLLFWWPILTPVSQSRIGAFPSVVYLVTACLASTVLGMTLTFAPETVYTAYRQQADAHGILAGLRAEGLTPRIDQQIAGLIMWMPCCLLYLAAIGGVLARWYGGAESALPSPTLRADPSPNAGRGEPDRRGATSIAKASS